MLRRSRGPDTSDDVPFGRTVYPSSIVRGHSYSVMVQGLASAMGFANGYTDTWLHIGKIHSVKAKWTPGVGTHYT